MASILSRPRTASASQANEGVSPPRDMAQLLRSIVLSITGFGVLGTLAELLLIGHTGELIRWLPYGLLLLSAIGILWMFISPTARALRVFQVLMIVVALSSVIGVWEHLQSSMKYQQQDYPDQTGLTLVWEAAKNANALLAPGVLAQVGFLGLAFTFRHPNLVAKKRQ